MSVIVEKHEYKHWIDELADDIIREWSNLANFNLSSGLSVSGVQHIGRLRGEITLTNTVMLRLRELGYNAQHILVMYTQDQWKGSEGQLQQFSNPEEARKYKGWRLKDVPDPQECHTNWVDHYWEDFGGPLDHFATDVNIVRTDDFYRMEKTKEAIRHIIKEKELIRSIINKYRGTNPYPEGWIPINPYCTHCHQIAQTEALDVDIEKLMVKYHCKACGTTDWSPIEEGKLNWRLEWTTLWYVLDVHFEPYGKDHATPGGSRDSCVELLSLVFGRRPPFGFVNEWVGMSKNGEDLGDMTSSGFIGFTPKLWLKIAEPEVLRYIYLKTPPKRRIVFDLAKIPEYVDQFDKAEAVFHGEESGVLKEEIPTIKRSYELAVMLNPELLNLTTQPFRIEYLHAAILSQLLPQNKYLETAIKRLQDSKILTRELTKLETDLLEDRLKKAYYWVKHFGPSYLQITLKDKLSESDISQISAEFQEILKEFAEKLQASPWDELSLKETMLTFQEHKNFSKKKTKKFFQHLYRLLLGRPQGPRMAPLLVSLDKQWVIKRISLQE